MSGTNTNESRLSNHVLIKNKPLARLFPSVTKSEPARRGAETVTDRRHPQVKRYRPKALAMPATRAAELNFLVTVSAVSARQTKVKFSID